MSHCALDTPLRIHWYLCPGHDPLPLSDLRSIARRCTEAGVYHLLLDGTPLAISGIDGILSILHQGGCRLSLMTRGTPPELDALAGIAEHSPQLWLDADGLVAPASTDLSSLDPALNHLRAAGFEAGISLPLFRDRLTLLGPLLLWAGARRAGSFKLPNIPLDARVCGPHERALCGPGDLDRLRDLLGPDALQAASGLRLQIHDLFLWELLGRPGSRHAEYGGCQGANALAYIDARGQVHACSSWPGVLGTLPDASLQGIWSGEGRRKLLGLIASRPQECEGCAAYARCRGGCRGLAVHFCSQDAKDLWCSGPR